MACLFAIRPQNTVCAENGSDVEDRITRAIQMEKETHILESERRNDTFENIIYNDAKEYKSPKYVVYGILGIIPALSLKWFYTLIPVHNLIMRPDYWYELPL